MFFRIILPWKSWGYQKVVTASDRTAISGLQPVVVPLYNTRPTADVFLAAVQEIGGSLAAQIPYKDEVEFLLNTIVPLMDLNGIYTAPTRTRFGCSGYSTRVGGKLSQTS